ncbi:MAG: hypothetical protein WKF75_10905 [Singulisphaera sp.]
MRSGSAARGSRANRSPLREAFRILYKEGRAQGMALDRIETDLGTVPEVREFVSFIREAKLRDQSGEGRGPPAPGLAKVARPLRELGTSGRLRPVRDVRARRGAYVSPRGLVDL